MFSNKTAGGPVLAWLHIGDLHMTEAGAENHRDLARIVALANALPPGSLDFAVLPGDNADDGAAEQFQLVRDAVSPLRLPLHILPGDHDFKPRNLDAYYAALGAETVGWVKPAILRAAPWRVSLTVRDAAGPIGVVSRKRCTTPRSALRGCRAPSPSRAIAACSWTWSPPARAALFMHTHPADLREDGERLGALLARPQVLCVDMGHTRYNELANDGGTIFMATRSTGQIEEGPAGFSIAAVDGRTVSWRFKPLDAAWPSILVTQPANRRLAMDASQVVAGAFVVRAKVLGDASIASVEVQVDDGDWMAMASMPGDAALWEVRCAEPGARVRVRARDLQGRKDEDGVEPARPGWMVHGRVADGSDRDRVGAWPEKGILDTQLGPSRNGKKW